MPVGVADLLKSERGVFALLLLFAATVLAVLKIIDKDMWMTFVKWLAMALIASKTVTTAVETVTTKKPQNESATPTTEAPKS